MKMIFKNIFRGKNTKDIELIKEELKQVKNVLNTTVSNYCEMWFEAKNDLSKTETKLNKSQKENKDLKDENSRLLREMEFIKQDYEKQIKDLKSDRYLVKKITASKPKNPTQKIKAKVKINAGVSKALKEIENNRCEDEKVGNKKNT